MELDGVGVRYGARGEWVLRDVRLELEGGRLVRVEGANGSGKSTLLRVAAGVSTPTRGTVRGRPGRCGYVPERFPGALPFGALEYLVRIGRVRGLTAAAARREAGRLLERFGAGRYAGAPLAELSKGSCQKVAVAQALLGGPELLVLDEAWTGLDGPARAELDAAAAERLAAGARVVFVDHDPQRLAGRVDVRCTVEGGGALRVARASGSGPGPGLGPGLGRGLRMLIEYQEHGGEPLRTECRAADSDEALRKLLARDGVHILAVRSERP